MNRTDLPHQPDTEIDGADHVMFKKIVAHRYQAACYLLSHMPDPRQESRSLTESLLWSCRLEQEDEANKTRRLPGWKIANG